MIARALVVALSCACAVALAPLTAPTDDDCALYLTGPGRSSAYDYSLNLLKGNFGYEGQHTCITYEAINQAYLDARNRILVSQPKGDWKAEDFASVGELLLDISINLARTYGLTYEEIEKGLPLIDTSRTLIREACPPVFSHVECRAGKYRRFDGLCNNLRHPTWGATMAPFQRLIGPLFADGINAPRIAHNGHDLPLSRVVSRTMHPDDGFHDHAGTVMVIAWGQFMDHDYTLTGTPLDPINRNDPEECCKRPPHLKHPYCNEIRVPDDDYFYRLWGVKCIDFVRGFPSPRPGCRLGSRVPFNTLTGSIDGNTVYGVTEKFARKLRTGYGGLLRMNPVFKEYGLKDLLPLKLDIPDEGCTRPNKNMYCFEAGEIRVNEQLVLTVMHTLMAREHNRVAEGLAAVNPHWDDETLFQEARRINIAEIQHITYNEFLPILLGKDVMEKFGLVLEKEGYWNGYDSEVNPDVLASFAAAAYRFGHSLLPTAVERWSKAHKFIASKRLSDLIRRPYDLYRAGVLDEYVMGLMNQVAQAMDDSITQEVTNHLFKKVGARFGMDLVSFNMQRGREFGLPGYMEFRKFCGLSGADTFQDLFGSMPNETVRKYESIFEHPIDVDLWSGGVSERPLPGSMLGPTFACIIATQFSYSRRGDRFWFELPNQPSSFTPEQLTEIRKSRLARIICDNTDIIDTVQLYPMVLPDHELNPRVPCRSGIIPSMDFSKWAEPVPFHGAAKQFITDAIATNEYAICNDYMNNSNATDKDNTQKDVKCGRNTTTVLDRTHSKKVTLKLNQNQTSKPDNDTILGDNCLDSANNETDCTQFNEVEPNKTNLNKNTDTIMKYVYKKTDKANVKNKIVGHSKNSISRKKRSPEKRREPSNFYKNDSPAPYPASRDERGDYILLKDKNRENVKNKDIPDFNIDTLHKDTKLPKSSRKENYNEYHPDTDNPKHSRSNKKDDSSDFYRNDSPAPYSASRDERDDFISLKDKNREIVKHRDIEDFDIDALHKDTKLPSSARKENYNEHHSDTDDPKHSRPNKNDKPSDFYNNDSPAPYSVSRDEIGDFSSPNDKNREIVKNTNIPHYNIETLHKDTKLPKSSRKENYNEYHPDTDNPKHPRSNKKDDSSDFYRNDSPAPYSASRDERDDFISLKDKNREIVRHRDIADFDIDALHKDTKLPNSPRKENYNEHHSGTDNPKHSRLNKNDKPSDFYKNDSPAPYSASRDERGDFSSSKDKNREIIKNKNIPHYNIETIHKDTKLPKSSRKENYNEYHADTDNAKRSRPTKKDESSEFYKNDSPALYSASRDERDDFISPKDKNRQILKNTDIKDISIETLHKNLKLPEISIKEDYNEYHSDIDNPKHPIKKDNRNYEQPRHDTVDREGKNTFKSTERDSRERGESKENTYNENLKSPHGAKIQNYDERNDFSKEAINDHRTLDSKIINHPKNLHKHNVGENNYKHNEEQYRKLPYEDNKSIENSKESTLFKKPETDVVEINYKKNPGITITPKSVEDVDLDGFSYERIHVNNKGQVEPIKDIDDNYDSHEITHTTASSPKLITDRNKKQHAPLTDVKSSAGLTNTNQKLVHINDGEVKPVVELNSENDNSESNEENSRIYQKGNLQDKVKYDGSSEKGYHNKGSNDKVDTYEHSGEKTDVKQQFERIPLDYNHDHKSQEEPENKETSTNSEDASEENINYGTLDSLTPKMTGYDENLKTKFGDLTITLPEIKLPDDILSYARIGVPKENEEKYNYSDDDESEENSREIKKGLYDTDVNHDYYGSRKDKDHEEYRKPNHQDELGDDDNVDLYEKFVRERFGKESSMGKKSEKLQASENRQLNSKLLETVQKLLKKTEKVKDEAEKSGDPNAGYMWTLEYGEDLY